MRLNFNLFLVRLVLRGRLVGCIVRVSTESIGLVGEVGVGHDLASCSFRISRPNFACFVSISLQVFHAFFEAAERLIPGVAILWWLFRKPSHGVRGQGGLHDMRNSEEISRYGSF